AQAGEGSHGRPMDEEKATRQKPANAEQLAAMEASLVKNQQD
ncbi:MAG TPA: DUF1244 domain-containing protein, partial [Erythrobacter sp.]|nr:DUF1244 domain-containing protein [Erythrobacter sp.]